MCNNVLYLWQFLRPKVEVIQRIKYSMYIVHNISSIL